MRGKYEHINTHVRPSSIVWALPALAAAVVVAIWEARGFYDGAPADIALFACFALACAVACASRGRLIARFDAAGRAVCALRDAVALAASAALSFLALELPWNGAVASIPPHLVCVELAIIALVLVAFYFLSMRRGALSAVAVAAFLFIGLAQYFVCLFKGGCILPADLLALGTAATVAGGFEYVLRPPCLQAAACALAGVALLSCVRPLAANDGPAQGTGPAAKFAPGQLRRGVVNIGVGLLAAATCFASVAAVDYRDAFGVEFNYWWQMDYYQRQGFLPTFVYCNQDLVVKQPQGYSLEAAKRASDGLQQVYAQGEGSSERRAAAQEQFRKLKPNIVVVMNESFADLSAIDGLGGLYSGPEFFNERLDAFASGALAVPVYGGGTANTEYEFFTGNSLTFLGAGKHPYEMFDLAKSSSVARQLAECGYRTSAVHPNLPTNWNRSLAYRNLGIGTFDDISAFEGAPVYNNGVTDKATYEHVLDMLRFSDDPQFVFDLTMQNHGGYSQAAVPAKDLLGVHPGDLPADVDDQLNGYLACIRASDADLEWFVEELRELDEPTVVLFFGDHHPSFSKAVNDALAHDDDAMVHEQRVHQTAYAMWANYEVAGAGEVRDDMASSMLAAYLFDCIGAPLTEFQQAQLGARASVKSLDFNGYLGADGAWYWYEDATPYADDVQKLDWVTYRNYRSDGR